MLGQGRQGAGEDSKGVLNNAKRIRELKLRRISKETAAIVVKRLLMNFRKAVTPH